MAFIRKNLLEVIEWRDESKNTVVYRFPLDNRYEIMTGSTLVVRESQMAIFVYKGKIADVFEPGTYKLSTENIPFLTQLLSLPSGFNSPIKAEIYYINTKQFTGQKWGTQNPIVLRDNDFGVVRLRGYGIYSYRIVDGKKFMKEMFGTNNVFTTEDVSEQMRPMVIQAITDAIAESKISLLDLAANYKEFSDTVVKVSGSEFEQYGIKLEKLVVENISLPEDVEKTLDERSKLGIMEDKISEFTQLQAAKALRDAANNPNGNNMASLGVGLGVASAMGNVFGNNLDKPKTKHKNCVKCGAEISERAKHCSECGAAQNPVCPKCKEMVSSRAKFCPNCGHNLVTVKRNCSNCGEELKATAKFCTNCGEKTK